MSTPQQPDPSTPRPPASGSTSVGKGDLGSGTTGARPTTTGPGQPTSKPTDKPVDKTDPAAPTTDDPLRGSRTSGIWVGVVVAVILLILLIIFIAQNTGDSPVKFLGWEGEAPVAVLLLAAAVIGMAVTALFGTLRILQLRRRIKRER